MRSLQSRSAERLQPVSGCGARLGAQNPQGWFLEVPICDVGGASEARWENIKGSLSSTPEGTTMRWRRVHLTLVTVGGLEVRHPLPPPSLMTFPRERPR